LEPESSTRSLARSAASGGAATLTSRLLGVARESVLSGLFGLSHEMDAYRMAFRVPNLLRDLFAEGVMSAAFVPTFTRRLTADGKDSALRLGIGATNALLVATGILVVLGIVFAEPLVRLFVKPEYIAVPGKLELTVWLSRIMMPFLTFIALAAVAMGMLNALHHFFLPALSPALFNVVSIASGLALMPLMIHVGQPPIVAFAIGTVAGGFAQWAVQWPLLRREGFAYRPVLDRHDEGLRRMLLLMGPGTLGLAATQVNLLVSSYLASQYAGGVSALEWAFRLMYLPIGLFGVSVGSATLPAVSRSLTEKDVTGARRTIADGLSLMFMMNIPAANRQGDVRAWTVHRLEHGHDSDGTPALRDRSCRVLGRPHCLAGLLRARREPHAGRGERLHGAPQRDPERGARPNPSRPVRSSTRHVDRGAVQRHGADGAAARPPAPAGGTATGGHGAAHRARDRPDGRRRLGGQPRPRGSPHRIVPRRGRHADCGHRRRALRARGERLRASRPRVQAGARRRPPAGPASAPLKARPLGLHPTVLVLASTHFLVDGFGNALTPLLPVLVPRLNLSLAAVGTLQMCYQLANSVAQLGVGYLAGLVVPFVGMMADRAGIEPTLLLMSGLPVLAAAAAWPLPRGKQVHSVARASEASVNEPADADEPAQGDGVAAADRDRH
jgi:hypothetical protein